MAKFKKGDRVRNTKATEYVPKGATGVVDEDDSIAPFVIWDEVTERAKIHINHLTWSQNEDSLELIEEKNPNDPLGIIGKKMKGFKFEHESCFGLPYDSQMDKYVGVEGVITSYDRGYNTYKCQFHDDFWYYPAELIMQHIVEETKEQPKELTLLEKFEANWEIKNKFDGTIAVQVVKQKTKDMYAIEWSDECFAGSYTGNDDELICTPPKEPIERKVVDLLSPYMNEELAALKAEEIIALVKSEQ